MSLTITEMRLEPVASAAAEAVLAAFPDVVFTRGRSDVRGQARAMAQNVSKPGHRTWIQETYLHGHKLQALVNAHPEAVDEAALEELFYEEMMTWTDEELDALSKHFTGDAFDIEPHHPKIQAIRQLIISLPGWIPKTKLLYEEGGLNRCHAQFVRILPATEA